MRAGQNKRLRGRNNNRKGPNPLTRSYESNGPDIKVRGTAQHVAEKYLQLARDAQSSGDPVMAESYLQHAEHYFRLIAAAHAAQQPPTLQSRAANEAEFDDEEEDISHDRFASVTERMPQLQAAQGQTPSVNPPPYQERVQYNQERGGQERYNQDRQNGERQPHRQERYGDRQNNQGQGYNRENRRYRTDHRQDPRFEERQEAAPAPRVEARPEFPVETPVFVEETRGADQITALPAFITAPTRASAYPDQSPRTPAESPSADYQEASGGYHLRPRRRRRPRVADANEKTSSNADAPELFTEKD